MQAPWASALVSHAVLAQGQGLLPVSAGGDPHLLAVPGAARAGFVGQG